MSKIDYEDYDEYLYCNACRDDIEDDSIFVMREYGDFFEKIDCPSEYEASIYLEKSYDYKKPTQRFFIVDNIVARIISKEVNVWDLDLNDYETLFIYGELLKEEKRKREDIKDIIVQKDIKTDGKKCKILTLPTRTKDGKELLKEIFKVKEEELLQLEWLRGYNRLVNPR